MAKYYTQGDSRYTEKYKKAAIKRVTIQLNRNTDKDLIDWIERLDNVQGTIKQILREYKK